MWSPLRQGALAIVFALAACSPRQIGMTRMADALTATAGAFGRDNDPEFVRTGAPATLKMVEMLLDEQPRHGGLLSTACSGFTQYAYAFLHVDAELAQPVDAALARDLNARAQTMYERAREYCLRALETRHPGLRDTLTRDPAAALAPVDAQDVPALYWLGVSWGGGLSVAENPLLRIAELGVIRSLFSRAIALDEQWEQGAIHEALIALEGLPPLLGGSAARARRHFERAVELSGGESAFAYVTMASSVAQPAGNRAEFERLLQSALAVDVNRRPELRLANLIAQKRARYLLSSAPALFRSR